MKQDISRCMRQASFALPGLLPSSRTHPRLAPSAALFRRFAASAPRSPPFSPANRMWRVHCFGQGPQGSVTTVTRPAQIKPRCSETETTQAPAPKERKNAAHGASRGSDADDLTKPRRGERNSRGLRADLAKQRTKLINFRVSQTFCCTRAHTSAINNSPRADVWPAGVFVASLGIVRHLSLQRAIKFSIVPATGLHSESKHFRRVPSKQGPPTRIFSQFLSSVLGCRKMAVAKCVRRKWRFTPTGRPYCCAYSSAQRKKPPPTRKSIFDFVDHLRVRRSSPIGKGTTSSRAAKLRLGLGL